MDRGSALLTYRVPELSVQDMVAGIRLLMVVIAAAGLVWLASLWMGSKGSFDTKAQDEPS
jgi:hypothetical protein